MNYPFETTLRVPYRDVDMQQVVNNSYYLHYAEIGRIAYLRERGMPYQHMVRQFDIEMVLAESHCYYKVPARFDDLLTVRVGLSDIGRSSFKVLYEIYREATEDVIAHIRTHHVCVDRKQFRPARIPEPVLKLFRPDVLEAG